MKKPIIKARKFGVWSIGVAAAFTPIAIAVSCGESSSEAAQVAQSIDTSQVDLSAISVSGTVTSPTISLGGTFLPANTKLQYKIGASDWLDEAAFKSYVTTNASTLTDSDLGAVKARLAPNSDKYSLSTPKEVTPSGKISRSASTPAATLIDTSAVNLDVITVSGTTTSPVINLNSFKAPDNTILLFQVGPSAWLNESGIKAYIRSNTASLTTEHLSAVKAHLEPASTAYTLANSREGTLNGSITKVVDTSSANLSVITVGGTTSAPTISLNNFVTPSGTVLRFQVGASAWLDQAATLTYITTNAASLTTAQLSAVKVHLEPASEAYTLTNSREVTLTGSITKVVDTSAANLSVITVGGTTSAPLINLSNFTAPADTVLRFQVGASAWLDQAAILTYITTNAASLTTEQLSAVKARLESGPAAYTLTSSREVTLTGSIAKPVIVILVDTTTANLSVVTVGGTTSAPLINLNNFIAPANTVLRFQVGASAWLDQVVTLAYITSNAASLTSAQLSAVKARLEPESPAYTLTSSREVTLTGMIAKVAPEPSYRSTFLTDLSSKTYFATDAISTNAKPQAVTLDPIAKSYEFLAGNYATLEAAKAAPSAEWKAALPSVVSFDKAARHLWMRVTVKTQAELGANTTITAENLQSFANDNQYFNLTNASRIQSIKSDITQLPGFADFSLNGLQITGNLYRSAVKLGPVQLPEGTTLEFTINNVTKTEAELANYINQNRLTLTQDQLDNINARLIVSDATKYVLNATKQGTFKYVEDLNFSPLSIDEWRIKFPQYASLIVNGNQLVAGSTFIDNRAIPSDFSLPSGIVSISKYAFTYSALPEGFTIPASVRVIEEGAFRLLRNFPKSIVLPPAITEIHKSAFAGTYSYYDFSPKFTLPATVTVLGDDAFMLAKFPVGFTVPESVKKIMGQNVFAESIYADGTAFNP